MSLENILKSLETVDRFTIVNHALRNPVLLSEANGKSVELVRDYLSRTPLDVAEDGKLVPYDAKKFDAIDAERKLELAGQLMKVAPAHSMEEAINAFKSAKLDSKAIGQSELNSLILEREVLEGISSKDSKKSEMYQTVVQLESYKQLQRQVEAGKSLDPDQSEKDSGIVINGVVSKVLNHYRGKFTEDVALALAKAAAATYQSTRNSSDIVKEGLKIMVKKTQDDLAKKNPNYVAEVADAVNSYLMSEVNSSGVDANGTPVSQIAMQRFYRAVAGKGKYGIGSREFSEVFKKK